MNTWRPPEKFTETFQGMTGECLKNTRKLAREGYESVGDYEQTKRQNPKAVSWYYQHTLA